MTRLRDSIIGENDLIEYLDKKSDFAFELAVLRLLDRHGFDCEHGGSYDDPVTQTPREFDLRATKIVGEFRFRLAVECKNLGANFPLLVSCLPRRPEESFHEVIHSFEPPSGGLAVPVFQSHARAIRFQSGSSMYKPGEGVGKSSAQVGRQTDGAIVSGDTDVYKKWAQALSSAQDLVNRANNERNCFSVVLPILVVPDGALWRANFGSDGSRLGGPQQVDKCSYYIGRSYWGGDRLSGFGYSISHLEFVTYTGLEEVVNDLFGGINVVFPDVS
jgi:hypothetical protein